MIAFILRRFAAMIPIFFGVSVISFLLMKLLPGDPTFFLLGPWATPDQRVLFLQTMGWDQPYHVQYWTWLSRTLSGDLGRSVMYSTPVFDVLVQRVANSAILAGIGFAIALLLGFSGGVLAAVRQYSFLDRALTTLAIVLASAPVYWLGLLMVYFFSLRLGLFPASGINSAGKEGDLGDLLWHAVLPGFTAALIPAAVIFRLTRSAMSDALAQPYIQAAVARGLSRRSVIFRHAARNVLAPLVNITALQFGVIFAGAMFTEVVFNWPGIGQLIFTAVGARDVPVIQMVVLFTGALFVAINLITDIVQGALDPRTRER